MVGPTQAPNGTSPTPMGMIPSALRVSFKDLAKTAIDGTTNSPTSVSPTDVADGPQTQEALAAPKNEAPGSVNQEVKVTPPNPAPHAESFADQSEGAVALLKQQPQDHSRLPVEPFKRSSSFSGPSATTSFQKKSILKGTSHSLGTPRQNEALSPAKHLIPLSDISSSSPRRRMTLAHRKPSWGEGESSDKEKENKLVRRLTRQRSEKEVLVGTPVKEGHTNFVLMYDMLMGIRVSVSRCQAKPPRSLFREDFSASHKMTFDVAGSEVTPSSRYDFKFKDYAPWVFRCIRDAFNVDPAEYLLSVTGKYILSELGSPGKSGSFFYYSSDYRYIIKTIKRAEKKAFMRIIHWYYEHCRINQNTTLCRILGLHRVKLKGHRKLHFIVMLNVFPGNKDIHEMYDLKGSTVGREFPEELAKDDPRAVLKDINWMNRGRKLELGPKKAQLLTEQLEKDVKFLADHNIMDYSLLVGIHDMKRGNTENIRDKTLGVYEPNPDAALAKQFTAASLMMSRPGATNPGAGPSLASGSTSAASIGASAPRSSRRESGPRSAPTASEAIAATSDFLAGEQDGPASLGPLTPESAITAAPAIKSSDSLRPPEATGADAETASVSVPNTSDRAACVFYADNGGFQASDENDQPLDTLYYLGTIDIFTTYDYVKKIEHFWKSFSQDAHMISAVPPPEYGQRFLKFMKGIIRKASNSQSENTSSDPPDRVQHLDAAPVSAGTPGSPGGPSSA